MQPPAWNSQLTEAWGDTRTSLHSPGGKFTRLLAPDEARRPFLPIVGGAFLHTTHSHSFLMQLISQVRQPLARSLAALSLSHSLPILADTLPAHMSSYLFRPRRRASPVLKSLLDGSATANDLASLPPRHTRHMMQRTRLTSRSLKKTGIRTLSHKPSQHTARAAHRAAFNA